MLAVFDLTSDSADLASVPRLLGQNLVVLAAAAAAAAVVVSAGFRRGREILCSSHELLGRQVEV
jgi:hypothetical protein